MSIYLLTLFSLLVYYTFKCYLSNSFLCHVCLRVKLQQQAQQLEELERQKTENTDLRRVSTKPILNQSRKQTDRSGSLNV